VYRHVRLIPPQSRQCQSWTQAEGAARASRFSLFARHGDGSFAGASAAAFDTMCEQTPPRPRT